MTNKSNWNVGPWAKKTKRKHKPNSIDPGEVHSYSVDRGWDKYDLDDIIHENVEPFYEKTSYEE